MQISNIIAGPVCLLAAPATADPGHLGLLAGHDHWVAGAAVGAAILIGLWGALKGDRTEDETGEQAPEPEAAP